MKSKQFISAAMVLLLTVSLPVSALAATYNIADGDITVNAAAAQQTVTQNGTTVEDSAPVITGTSENTYTVAINAEAGTTARVTLSGVEINASGISKAAVSTGGHGEVTIELDGENKLTGGVNHAGLEKNNGADLTISDSNSNEGSLVAAGGTSGAGIGGGYDGNGNKIVITGGTVNATGGARAAGIGGGHRAYDSGNGSGISIRGGTVNATGGYGAAGIGGGYGGNGSDINLFGDNVTAEGGYHGAGIGGGYEGNGDKIWIYGGNVTAEGGNYGAGIGGGDQGNGSDITISGGNVTAEGGRSGAGIGGGDHGHGDSIKIYGGNVTAVGTDGAAVGGGFMETSGSITVSSSTQLSVQGEESDFDVSGLYTSGKILYFAPGADMKTDQPEKILVGTVEYKPAGDSSAQVRAHSAPAYHVTGRDGSALPCTAVQKDGVLTLTVNADFAIFSGTLGGIETLKALGVEKLTFVTGGAVSTFALADLPEGGGRDDVYALTHDGNTVTFTLGAENTDLRGILG